MKIQRFPEIREDKFNDKNPAIRLYGRRFYADQTEIELLSEFLLVFASQKSIGGRKLLWERGFPDAESLKNWPADTPLEYMTSPRLALKLFAFLGSSRLETRHPCHRNHFETIVGLLKNGIDTSPGIDKEEVLTLVEQVLVGFVGIAQNRTWCTHAFLPVSASLLACESIWKHKQAQKKPKITWEEATGEGGLFDHSAHDFMARGGELLFLQLLNVARLAEKENVHQFEEEMDHPHGTATHLLPRIETGLKDFLGSMPYLSQLVDWVEAADTSALGGLSSSIKSHRIKCGWIPAESWKESYLFGYELANICEAVLDPLEKLDALDLCCVFQVLRSLCSQAARYSRGINDQVKSLGGNLGFAWVVTDPDLQDKALKLAGRTNFTRIQEVIYEAIRSHYALEGDPLSPDLQRLFKEADKHSSGLFAKLGKRIGLITPWKGPGTRLTLNERLLRYLVMAIVKPGERMTLASFEGNLFKHYGIGINGPYLERGVRWSLKDPNVSLGNADQTWFERSLRASGFLIPLSDAVSLVHNPFNEI